jgi:hypothetical protein
LSVVAFYLTAIEYILFGDLLVLQDVLKPEVAVQEGVETTEIIAAAVTKAKLEVEAVADANGDRCVHRELNQKAFAQQVDAGTLEGGNMELAEERGSEGVNATEREERGKGEQENWGVTVSGTPTPTPRKHGRERERHGSEQESQPKKRKRNIMSPAQVRIMENALLCEPEMQRSPRSIQHWTNHLNHLVRTHFHFPQLFHRRLGM